MAEKIKMLKLLQELNGFSELTNRRPQARSLGLFLLEMRSHMTHTAPHNRKRNITVESSGLTDIPHPVKITHLRSPTVHVEQLVSR